MQVLAIIQARMGSSRLPGKVLSDLRGKPMLQWQLERLKLSKKITELRVATSELPTDRPLKQFCDRFSIPCFLGSETDVLGRFYYCAKEFQNQSKQNNFTVIRLTGDCPLIDPYMIDDALGEFENVQPKGCRYYGYSQDLPDGMDFEIFTFDALEEAHRLANDEFSREHVTPYLWMNPEQFGLQRYSRAGITPGLRFSVDYPADKILVEKILDRQEKLKKFLGVQEISDLLKAEPQLLDINADIIKNEGLLKTALQSSSAKYGVLVPEVNDTSASLFDWCLQLGLNLWLVPSAKVSVLQKTYTTKSPKLKILSQTQAPKGWVVYRDYDSNLSGLGKYAEDPSVEGIVLEATNKYELASQLMYLCHGRFNK